MMDVINMISTKLRLWGVDDSKSFSKHQQTNDNIIFSEEDLRGVQTSHNDAVAVSMTIANYDIKWCLVDNKSSADVIFYDAFFRM